MSNDATKAELEALRTRVAELEAPRAEPVKVEMEGLEGLKRWSRAVEARQLDAFYFNHAVPEKVYIWLFWAFLVATTVVCAWSIWRHLTA